MAKLDPENAKTAKDIMDENARKRKREEEGDDFEIDGIVPEEPLKNPKKARKLAKKLVKKQKLEHKGEALSEVDRSAKTEVDAREAAEADSDAVKKLKVEKQRISKKDKKIKETSKTARGEGDTYDLAEGKEAGQSGLSNDGVDINATQAEDVDLGGNGEMLDEGLDCRTSRSTATPSPTPQSLVFDNSVIVSGPSSVSSIAPPSKIESLKPEPTPTESIIPKTATKEELLARLQKTLELKRAARNAPRSKSEFQEHCKRREARRLKKARNRRLQQEEEEQKNVRSSPLLLPLASGSNPALSLSSPPTKFSFTRIIFPNGDFVSSTEPSKILPAPKKKGPQDPGTALAAAEAKQVRISELEPAARAKIAEQDLWINASKRAHGETVRNDPSLLKKTLKRKAQAKSKSEKEWGERIEGVKAGQAIKAKRRDENIRKRKEEKRSGQGGKKAKAKPKGRPGFEGSFRAKAVGVAGTGKWKKTLHLDFLLKKKRTDGMRGGTCLFVRDIFGMFICEQTTEDGFSF